MISFELGKEIEKFFFRFSTSAGTKNRGLRVESNLRISDSELRCSTTDSQIH